MSDNRTFVSYSRADSEFALKLASDLRRGGADVWLDQLDIAAGSRWDSAVEDALRQCSRVLVVLSPKAVASQNVLDEVSFALGEGKTVVPVLVETCTLPLRLHRLQHVDFTRGYDAGLTRLLATLGVSGAGTHETPRAAAASPPPPPRPPVEPEPVAAEPDFVMPSAGDGGSRRLLTMVGAAAAVLVLVVGVIWSSSRPGVADTPAETAASQPPAETAAPQAPSTQNTAPPISRGDSPLAALTNPPRSEPLNNADSTGLDALIRSLSGRTSLTEEDLTRLARAELDACPVSAPASCSAKASDAVQSLVDSFCARQAGPPPRTSDEAASVKYDIAKLTCTQNSMSIVLKVMDERSKDAIRHIKPG